MNIVNRVVIVILLIVAVLAVTAVALFPDFTVARFLDVARWANDIVGRMVTPDDNLILIAIGAMVDFVLLLFLALELRRPGAKAVRVQRVEEGTAMLTVDSIKQRLSYHIDALEDVVSVKPQVQIQRDKVRVAVDVQATATANVPAKAQEVVSIVRMVVTEMLGLELRGQPQVNIRTRGYKETDAPAALIPEPEPWPELVAPAPEPEPEPLPEPTPAPDSPVVDLGAALAPVQDEPEEPSEAAAAPAEEE